jgi:hypothetical protein
MSSLSPEQYNCCRYANRSRSRETRLSTLIDSDRRCEPTSLQTPSGISLTGRQQIVDKVAKRSRSMMLPTCDRSSTSPASRRRWHRGLPSAAWMSWRYWKESAMKWDCRRRSVSIRAPSSCRETLKGGMPQCPLVPCRCARKSGELAQIRQQRKPPRGKQHRFWELSLAT